MTRAEVVARLGTQYQSGGETIRYRVELDQFLLEKYNMPIYYGNYRFRNGSPIRFQYGFEYP